MRESAIVWLLIISLTQTSKILCEKNYETCCHTGVVCSCVPHINFHEGSGETYETGKQKLDPSECLVYKIRNVSECNALEFEGNMNERKLGLVRLHQVIINFSTNLNFSFINARWTSMYIRLSGMERDWSLCRNIKLSERAVSQLSIKELFYSCRLLSPNMTDQEIMLEYHATNGLHDEFGRFSFRLDSPIDRLHSTPKWENEFLYVEWQLPILIAHWHHPSEERPAKYDVLVKREDRIRQENFVFSENGSAIGDLGMEMKYDTMHFPGKYVFEVKKECSSQQKCEAPRIATVKIAPVSRLLQYISLSILFLQSVLVLVILWMTAEWYRALAGKPIVLVMYSPSRCAHVKAVRALVDFLRDQCRVKVLFDLDDIKDSLDADPVRWYTSSLQKADDVLMVASPPPPGIPDKSRRLHPSINLEHAAGESLVNVDLLSLRLLAPCLANRRPRIVACLPPGTTVQYLPPEVRTFHNYNLPTELEPMLRALRGVRTVLPCLPPPPGADHTAAEARHRLWSAMKAAEQDLRDRPPAPESLSPWERPSSVGENESLLSSVDILIKEKSSIELEIGPERVGMASGQRRIVCDNNSYPGPIEEVDLLNLDKVEKGLHEQQKVQSQPQDGMSDLLQGLVL